MPPELGSAPAPGCTLMSSTVAGTSAPSKNMTISKFGARLTGQPSDSAPPAIGDAAGGAATSSGLIDLLRLTRVTPSTLRRRASSVATSFWPAVQPLSSIAGAAIAPRTPLPPAARPRSCP